MSTSAPKPPIFVRPPARVAAGDLWQLGRHRLYCGDCTDPADVSALVGEGHATLSITSPPYNAGRPVELPAGLGGRYLPHIPDRLPRAEYVELLCRATQAMLGASAYAIVNIQLLAGNKVAVMEWLYAMRGHLVDVIVWDKGRNAPARARNVLNSRFELLVLFSPERNPTRAIRTADFRGTVDNVYSAAGRRRNPYFSMHGATFPLHLPTWLMSAFDASGEGTVFDPFCGTGTTIVAAEREGRTCLAMEIEPAYCDIALQRWEALSPRPACLVASRGAPAAK